jgi:predicted amidophosphoribosyltransferase
MEPAATMRCRVCGQSASARARFCARCGARLSHPTPDASRGDPDDDPEQEASDEHDR